MIEDLQTAFLAAVEAGDPTKLVKARIRTGALDDWFEDRDHPRPIHVLAVGKAAPRMVWGLIEANVPFSGIGVTTAGQRMPTLEAFRWHVGGHPVPDAASFAAGRAVLDWVAGLPDGAQVLVLLSGGASACLEAADDEAAAITLHRELLASGLPIAEMNRRRAAASSLKGGRLGAALARRATVRVWLLSDVPPGQERLVGSGPFDRPGIDHQVLANADTVARAAAGMMEALGHPTRLAPRIEGPLDEALDRFLADLAPGTARVAAGEADVAVPPGAPVGGRCQHAALAAAARLTGTQMFFAGATDGVDGTTREAAAWSTAATWGPEAEAALAAHDAHGLLAARGQTLRLGATGTNLNDLWIVLAQE